MPPMNEINKNKVVILVLLVKTNDKRSTASTILWNYLTRIRNTTFCIWGILFREQTKFDIINYFYGFVSEELNSSIASNESNVLTCNKRWAYFSFILIIICSVSLTITVWKTRVLNLSRCIKEWRYVWLTLLILAELDRFLALVQTSLCKEFLY